MAAAGTKSTRATWTPAQDELLAHWQAKVGNRWSVIAQYIPGKTGQQCAQRWRHRVNPAIRKDKWSSEEDIRLTSLVAQYPGAWAEISRHMPGRTDQQCMGRWKRHLDPGIRRAGWTAQEDALLCSLVEQHNHAWSTISSFIPGRIAQQCRSRWKQLSSGVTTPRSRGLFVDASPAAPHTRGVAAHDSSGRAPDDDEDISELSDHESDPGSQAGDLTANKRSYAPRRRMSVTAKSPGSTAHDSQADEGLDADEACEDDGDNINSQSASMTAGLRSRVSLATGSYEPHPLPTAPPVPLGSLASPTRRLRSTRSAVRRVVPLNSEACPLPLHALHDWRVPPLPSASPAAGSSVEAGASGESSQLCKHGSSDPAERLNELCRVSLMCKQAEEEGSITDGQAEDTSPIVVDTTQMAQTPSARRTTKYHNQSVPPSWKCHTTTPKAQRIRPPTIEPDTLDKGRRQQEQAASTEETIGDEGPGVASPPLSATKGNPLSPPAATPWSLLHAQGHHCEGVHDLLSSPDWAGIGSRVASGLLTPSVTGSSLKRRLIAAAEADLSPLTTPMMDSPARRQRLTRRSIAGSLDAAAGEAMPVQVAAPVFGGEVAVEGALAASKPKPGSCLARGLALLGQMDEQGSDRYCKRVEHRSEASANDRASLNVAAVPARSAATESSQGNLGSALGTQGGKQQVASSVPKSARLRRELHLLL